MQDVQGGSCGTGMPGWHTSSEGTCHIPTSLCAGQNLADRSKYAWLGLSASAAGQLRGLSRGAQQQVARDRGSGLRVPTYEHIMAELLTHVPDAAIRQQVCQPQIYFP